MFKLLVAFKVLGGCFLFIVIGFTIYELKNKIVEFIKIQIGNKKKEMMETETTKNEITGNNKKIELVADMGIHKDRATNQKEQATLYLSLSHQIFIISNISLKAY